MDSLLKNIVANILLLADITEKGSFWGFYSPKKISK